MQSEKMSNILVSTFGTSWAVAAELLAITQVDIHILDSNKDILDFKSKLVAGGFTRIDELWLICTHGKQTNDAINNFVRWMQYFPAVQFPVIRYLSLNGLEDLTNETECKQMADFIYRVVLRANEAKGEGKLLLSLTGGRKTMSTDMQRAADIFGCDVLFHIADSFDDSFRIRNTTDLIEKLPSDKSNRLNVVQVVNNKRNSYIADVPSKLTSAEYPIEFTRGNKINAFLVNEITERIRKSEALHFNAYNTRTRQASQTMFHGLQQLPPAVIDKLTTEKPTYEWLQQLPKTDLHCHFGGILDTAGLVRVAMSTQQQVIQTLSENSDFSAWYSSICIAVKQKEEYYLQPYLNDKNKLRIELFPTLPKPLVVCAFIMAFAQDVAYLDSLIFGDCVESEKFQHVGIERYEKLGDLQGSALLQSEATIRAACVYLKQYCREHNLKYLELRCSPCNYTFGGLNESAVVKIMHSELHGFEACDIRLIVIGSRHGDMEIFKRHVQLTQQLLNDKKYKNFVVGFDVAGNEKVAKPKELRSLLLPLLEKCLHLTIHAGENEPVSNIWEAVYELNTDRIGHGLTLVDNMELLERIKDRKIVIELCPSSNLQICDYSQKAYPLKQYLQAGLKVTLNTDNPGISRTDITSEYWQMAEREGLTKMEVLYLLRNSFQGIFLPKDTKKLLIIKIEETLHTIIASENK